MLVCSFALKVVLKFQNSKTVLHLFQRSIEEAANSDFPLINKTLHCSSDIVDILLLIEQQK